LDLGIKHIKSVLNFAGLWRIRDLLQVLKTFFKNSIMWIAVLVADDFYKVKRS